jgi:16S rRNA (adenine1518-N6/adenine1519-N6)-dimethyltransferase
MSAGVRELLERHGLAARRDLGQNFLIDAHVAERLVSLAGVAPGEGVVEIGTGLGILTRALAARAERVITLEIDAGLVRLLRSEGELPPCVRLVHGDALKTDLEALVAEAGARVRVVANLPYAVSAPLLRRLLDLRHRLLDWSVMLQRDLALRLLARRGSRDYGSLAVLHQLTVSGEKCMELSPRCFFPVPQVRSTFVRMRPLTPQRVGPAELAGVEAFLRAAFSQRRKTLRNALRGSDFAADAVRTAIAQAGLAPEVRAEELSPEQLLALARQLAPR